MELMGDNIFIRFLEEADAENLCQLNLKNKEFFQAYSVEHDENYYTVEYQREMLKKGYEQRKKEERFFFGIFLNSTEELIGDISIFDIRRGPLQRCMIGYALDKEFNGKGYMSEAAKLVVKFALEELSLHRIEAGVMPHNIGSMRVLEKAGFQKEGISRRNVKINGKWQDHQMLAVVSDKE